MTFVYMAADIAWACTPKRAIERSNDQSCLVGRGRCLIAGLTQLANSRLFHYARLAQHAAVKYVEFLEEVQHARFTVCRCGRQPRKPQPHAWTQSQASRRWVLAFIQLPCLVRMLCVVTSPHAQPVTDLPVTNVLLLDALHLLDPALSACTMMSKKTQAILGRP